MRVLRSFYDSGTLKVFAVGAYPQLGSYQCDKENDDRPDDDDPRLEDGTHIGGVICAPGFSNLREVRVCIVENWYERAYAPHAEYGVSKLPAARF